MARKMRRDRIIGLGAIALFLAAGVAAFLLQPAEVVPEDWMFIVNGVVITESDVDGEYATLTPLQKQTITRNDVARRLFEFVLLLDAARKQGLSVTQEEYDAAFQQYLSENNLSKEQLLRNLEQQGVDFGSFQNTFAQEALIQKLMDREAPRQLGAVDGDAVRAFYETSVYKTQGIAFEEVEQQVLEDYLDQKQEEDRRKFIANLRMQAQVVVRAEEEN